MRNEEFRIIAIRRLRSLANILFFDRKPGAKEPWTKAVWVYDLRTNRHFTLKTRRLTRADLDEFWLRDETLEDSANLPDPHVLAEEIAEDLRASLEQIESVLVDLQQRAAVRSE